MKKTFNQLYNEKKVRPTPAQEFIAEVAALTKRTPLTIRMWLSGAQTPDALVQEIIADHFGVDVAGLFPQKPNTEQDEH